MGLELRVWDLEFRVWGLRLGSDKYEGFGMSVLTESQMEQNMGNQMETEIITTY